MDHGNGRHSPVQESCTGMGEPGLGGKGRETESPEKERTPRAGLWFVAADDEQHFDQP